MFSIDTKPAAGGKPFECIRKTILEKLCPLPPLKFWEKRGEFINPSSLVSKKIGIKLGYEAQNIQELATKA